MALFEFEDGHLVPAQFGYPVAQDLGPDLVDAICQQVLQIVSRPLFPVTWRDMTGQDDEETPRLTALDVTGQIVSVEILKELDSETLITSLSRLAEVASISWSDLAAEYPSGPDGFRTGWAQFRDSMPPAVGPGPRLIMVAGDIDPSVRPALSVLATSGVEVHLMNLRQMSNGRLFLDVNAVGPRLYGHAPQLLASAAAAPELAAATEQPAPFEESVPAESAIPAPPAAPEADAVEELADVPPAPAPAEVPTLDTATQAPVENPLVAEAMAAPIADDITEAAEAAQAQAIPESLAEYGIEPVTDEADAAQVEAPAFPLAPPVEDATEVMDSVPPMPVAPAQDAPASASEDGSSKRSGTLIDPTKPALIFGVVVVLFGAIWGPWMAARPVTDLDLTQSLRAGVAQQQSDEEPSPALTTTPPPAPTTTPVISSVQVLSWNNDDGDRPDRAINMIDSDPSTSWSSRWFDNNQFRDETSVTIVVKLQQKATVSSVTLNMDPATSGGELVVRNVTDPSNPRGGTELASSALSPTTTIKLPTPVETDSIALQFRSMPKGQDGRNWAWISELTVQ